MSDFWANHIHDFQILASVDAKTTCVILPVGINWDWYDHDITGIIIVALSKVFRWFIVQTLDTPKKT